MAADRESMAEQLAKLPTQEAQQEETAEEQPAVVEKEKVEEKMVPTSRLAAVRHEVKDKIAKLEAQIAEKDGQLQKFASLQDEMRSLKEQFTPKTPEPDYTEDPEAYTKAQIAATKQEMEEIRKKQQEQDAQTAAQYEQQEIVGKISASESAFMKENEDYPQVYAFLENQQAKILAASRGLTEQQALQAARMGMLAEASQWIKMGVDPAERMYELGKVMGYQAVPEEATEQVERVQKGQQKSSPPGAAGGAPPQEKLNDLDAILRQTMKDAGVLR